MYGSIFYNCWGALVAFTVAFIVHIMEPYALPIPTLITSAIWALAAFAVMFGIRLFLGYILYTPEEMTYAHVEEMLTVDYQQPASILPNTQPTAEFADDASEEVAQVVRTMLHKDEQTA